MNEGLLLDLSRKDSYHKRFLLRTMINNNVDLEPYKEEYGEIIQLVIEEIEQDLFHASLIGHNLGLGAEWNEIRQFLGPPSKRRKA